MPLLSPVVWLPHSPPTPCHRHRHYHCLQVMELRFRAESPKAPTDIFGADAPSDQELQQLLRAVEAFLVLRGRAGQGSEDGSTVAGSGLDGGGAGGPSGAPSRTSSPREGSTRGGGTPAPRPALGLSFLQRLEAMLTVEGGLDLVDGEMAAWLARVLPLG